MTDLPFFTSFAVGFRCWEIRPGDERLWPYGLKTAGPWEPGVNTAKCYRHPMSYMYHGMPLGPPHEHEEAPRTDCRCGFHAFHDLEPRRSEIRRATGDYPARRCVGIIKAHGRIQVHAAGFRAQYVEVVALEAPSNANDQDTTRACAEAYGVPLIEASEMESMARLHGMRFPESFTSSLEEPLPSKP